MATGPWGPGEDQQVFRVKVSWRANNQLCMTGFHLRDTGIQGHDPESVLGEVKPWVDAEFRKILHVQDTLVGIDVEDLVTREGFSFSYNNTAGLAEDDPAPTFITVPVTFKGSIRRRYGQGRALWPLRSEGHMAKDVLTAGGQTTFGAVATDLATRFIGNPALIELHLINLHEALDQTASRPAVPATWYDVTSVRVNTAVKSLRRRMVGVGS